MCRHLAYVGEPVALGDVISEPEHGLLEQTWAPRDMRGGGTINADGFGVGWWQHGRPVRYRSVRPMWADADFLDRAGALHAGAFLAAVRSATPGMSTTHTACAPFADDTWLFSHNGCITGWPDAVADLAGGLDATRLLTTDAPTDSAFLWALLRARLAEGRDPVPVVADTVRDVAARAPGSRLNLLLTDGERIIATTWSHSLWTGRGGCAMLLSSEPFELDGATTAWSEVPDGSLVLADRYRAEVRPLSAAAPRPGMPAARAAATVTAGPPGSQTEGEHSMNEPEIAVRFTPEEAARRLRAEADRGLRAAPKWLSPMWLYDQRGSELFERITELPEYYPTRAEHEILQSCAAELAELTEAGTLVELGSGSSAKTRLLLDALEKQGTLRTFAPVDVSESALREAATALAAEYPQLRIRGVVDDFTAGPIELPEESGRVVALLGGTIGNLLPEERAAFHASVRAALRPGEWLLIGTDLVKSPERLIAAYDDAQGVTAEFNRNVLHVLNRELGGDLPVANFDHVARFNAGQERMEMQLRARESTHARVSALDLPVHFAAGEELHTEISAKFRTEAVRAELAESGFRTVRQWCDAAGDFAVTLARLA